MKWWIGVALCVILFVFIGAYASLKMRAVWSGVKITALLEPTGTSLVEIKGNARNAVYLSLNGREIFIEKDGSFKEPLALLPGLSVVTLSAQDKFGTLSEKKIEVMYNENNQVAVLTK